MNNAEVAAVLVEIGVLLELKGENPFKSRAYATAARIIETLPESLGMVIGEERLRQIPGIGEALQEKITQLVTTGRLPYHEELKASIPAGLLDLLQIRGLGPKKVRKVHQELGVATVDEMEQACRDGRIAALDGFGLKSQAGILEAIAFRRQFASKHLLFTALAAAEPLLEVLRGHPSVVRCSTAGSLRRWKEIIGDVDLLASSQDPAAVMGEFVSQEGIHSVIAQGETKASVILSGGIQADLRVVSDTEFPFALAYFTGSKEHNIVMRQRAIARGLRLNEYGLFRSSEETRDPALRLPCRTEQEIFEALDLPYIEPELREDHGEFEAAGDGVPAARLVEWTDLKGSLHNHTNWSDGTDTIDDAAKVADHAGCAYWAITDHSQASFQASGLSDERVRAQIAAIAVANQKLADSGSALHLFAGTEVDVLKSRLDFDDDLLCQLDVVVASLHVAGSNEADNTQRLIRAAENPFVHMLGHLTGRLLLDRPAYPVNQHAVIDACAATGTWIELNANPHRFDMDWRLWQYARSKGVKCAINCDAHRPEHLGFLRLGAGIARKGGLTKADVVNTLPLEALKKALAMKRTRHGCAR